MKYSPAIKVYVAGRYSGDNVLDVLRNIGRGEAAAAELFDMGFAPFCPWHDKDYVIKNPEGDFTVEKFYNYSMAWLEVCDIVLLLPGWETSKGTLKEIERAEELGIPVIYPGRSGKFNMRALLQVVSEMSIDNE
jgi:hypothetical protein